MYKGIWNFGIFFKKSWKLSNVILSPPKKLLSIPGGQHCVNYGNNIPEDAVPAVKFSDLVSWNFFPDGNDTYTCRNCSVGNIRKSGTYTNLIKHCSKQSCFGFVYRNVNHPHHKTELQPLFRAYILEGKEGRKRTTNLLQVSNFTFGKAVGGLD